MFTLQYGWDFKHPPSTTLLPFLLWTRPCHFSWGGDFSSLLIPAAWLRILLRMIPSAFGCFNTSVSIAKWHLSILAVKKVALREWSFRLIIFYCSDVFLTVWISNLYIWAFSHFIGLKETTCMSVLECNAPFANFIISAGDDVGHEVVSCNPWLIWWTGGHQSLFDDLRSTLCHLYELPWVPWRSVDIDKDQWDWLAEVLLVPRSVSYFCGPFGGAPHTVCPLWPRLLCFSLHGADYFRCGSVAVGGSLFLSQIKPLWAEFERVFFVHQSFHFRIVTSLPAWGYPKRWATPSRCNRFVFVAIPLADGFHCWR